MFYLQWFNVISVSHSCMQLDILLAFLEILVCLSDITLRQGLSKHLDYKRPPMVLI